MSEREHLEKLSRSSFKDYKFFDGTITGFDMRILLMSDSQFKGIYKSFKSLGLKKTAKAIVRKLGYDFGLAMSQTISDRILDEKIVFEYLLLLLNKAGWFKYWHLNFSEDNINVEIRNSPEAYEPDYPSCFYIEGVLEGASEHYFKEKMRAIEKTCISRGDAFCEFNIIKRKKYYQDVEKKTELELILKDFDNTAKSKGSLILAQDGEILVQRLQHKIDEDTFSLLLSNILTSSNAISNVLTGNYIQTIINATEGTIMVMPVEDKAFIAAILDKHSSPNLIGIAMKTACDKISKTL
ncbi:MAG: V4R domain-containing protein [Candidatus Helarchaeota archaeon]